MYSYSEEGNETTKSPTLPEQTKTNIVVISERVPRHDWFFRDPTRITIVCAIIRSNGHSIWIINDNIRNCGDTININ